MLGQSNAYKQTTGSCHYKKEITNMVSLNYNENVKVSFLYDLCRATCNKDNGIIIKKDGSNFLIKIKDVVKL